jgi:hypothetical protein
LFESFANALDKMSDDNIRFLFILRGSAELDFLRNRKFKVEYRRSFISDVEMKIELDSADILYLPIKFNKPAFYLYSLSTKMISYLSASGTILYHGPQKSAANNLLEKYKASVSCTSINTREIINSIEQLINNDGEFSRNAKQLAKQKFDLKTIQNNFWSFDIDN